MDHKDISQTALFLISENCPRALYAYIICCQHCDEENLVYIDRKLIDDRSLSWTRFCNDIKSLARQGLLEWTQDEDGLTIIVAEQDL